MAVIGLFVTPQNTAAIPHATTSGIGSPNIGARKLPSEAPTNMAGAISPPLNPAPRDTAVIHTMVRKQTVNQESG